MNKTIDFGYPTECRKCEDSESCSVKGLSLQVKPFFQEGNTFRLMLIGQDPTIFVEKERVKEVLMLDEENSQLRRWLGKLFEKDKFDSITIYATNLVKCTFPEPPSTYRGKHFLKPYFENCKKYLIEEIKNFKPSLVLTLGEPSHRYVNQLFDNDSEIADTMKGAFGTDDKFIDAYLNGFKFKYSPTLHIKTFRVAEIYGDLVKNFKGALENELNSVK